MKRWCVFLYTKQLNKVENYIVYLLESIHKSVDRVCVVCDENQSEAVKLELGKYADSLIIMDEIPADKLGYMFGIDHILDKEGCINCDELLLMDDDIFGPLDSFEPMLNVMEKNQCDFWGIIKQEGFPVGQDTDCLATISIEFMAFRGRILNDADFRAFWNECDKKYIEENMVSFFEKKGYVCDGYITAATDYDLCKYKSYEMIKDMGCPVLFRKRFCSDTNMNDNLNKALNYIGSNFIYNLNMIWEDVLNTVNIFDLKRNLNLNYIISSEYDRSIGDVQKIYRKTAVAAHIYYSDRVEMCMSYLAQLPTLIDIYITTGNQETFEILKEHRSRNEWQDRKNIFLSLVPNRGRDMSALWVADRKLFDEYEYVCFVHDKKTSGNLGTAMSGEMYQYDVLENCLKNSCYANNILALFEGNPIIGFLCPPFPKFFDYINLMGNEWTECYERTLELAKELQIDIIAEEDKPPFAFSNTFWCRTKALKPLADRKFKYEDFPQEPLPRDGSISHALERIYGYVAQSQGYLSAVIENEDYAQMEINSMQFLLGERIQWNIVEGERRKKLEVDTEILRDYIEGLEEVNSDAHERIKVLECDDKVLRENIDRLETDNGVLRNQIVKTETDNGVLKNQIVKTETDNGILRSHIAKLESDSGILRNYIGDLENVNVNAQKRIEVLERDDKILRGHIDRLENDSNILRNYIFSLEAQLAEKKEYIFTLKLIRFALSCKKLYIYGAGKIGMEASRILERFMVPYEGFLVSDKVNAMVNDSSPPKYCYSETNIEEEDGIIVALNDKNLAEVMPTLSSVKKVFYYMEEKKGE